MNLLDNLVTSYAGMPGKFDNNDDNNQAIELYYLLIKINKMLTLQVDTIAYDDEQIEKFDTFLSSYLKILNEIAQRPIKGPRTHFLLSKSLPALDEALKDLKKALEDKKVDLEKENDNEKLEKLKEQECYVTNFEENLLIFKQNLMKAIDGSSKSLQVESNQNVDFSFGNRTDVIGRDPYNLRAFLEQNEEPRIELLNHLAPQLNTEPNYIPHIFHTIWLGSEWPALGVREMTFANNTKGAYTIDYLEENVASIKETNPNAAHLFWTDRDIIPDSMQRWCDDRGIKIVKIQTIFPLKGDPLEKELYTLYLNEKARQSYAAAADILRLMILRVTPGIYLDIDIKVERKLEEIAAKYGIRLNLGGVKYSNSFSPTREGLCNNDIIMANKHGKETLDEFCYEVIKKYHKTYAEIFINDVPVDSHVIRYQKQFKDIPYYYLYKTTPMLTTGPQIIGEYYENNSLNRNFSDHNVSDAPFFMENVQTWIRKEGDGYSNKTLAFTFENRELAIKHIVTYILYDLKREPRVLRLDNYKAPLEQYNIGDIVIQILFTHAGDELSEIESIVGFKEFCKDSNTAEAVFNAVKKGQAPKLNLEPLLFNLDNRQVAIHRVVTDLLQDLTNDPGVLHLDKYQELLKKYNIGDEVVQILFTHANDKLKEVKSIVGLDKFCTEPSTANILTNAMREGQLPALNPQSLNDFFRALDINNLKTLKDKTEISKIYINNLNQILNLIDSHTYELDGRGEKIGEKNYSIGAFRIRNIITMALAHANAGNIISHNQYSSIVKEVEFDLLKKREVDAGFFGQGKIHKSTVNLYQEIIQSLYPMVKSEKSANLVNEANESYIFSKGLGPQI
ncbi:glycosyltransferase [Legionella busanensis]|uniref:Glycosyltransferase n=1 Tax=Legionella busanensis TaxID=190655 RepID=A0A378JN89_9GAMM|nr:glycosyltransferase [Legionella busanensis]STX52148.1 glycosyltransferase [Legionella busanensis]